MGSGRPLPIYILEQVCLVEHQNCARDDCQSCLALETEVANQCVSDCATRHTILQVAHYYCKNFFAVLCESLHNLGALPGLGV